MELARRGQAGSVTNPFLTYSHISAGLLTDITGSLKFEIYDVSDEVKQATPVRVFPGSGQTTVDLNAHKLSTGRYAAVGWTVSGSEAIGRHEIRWYVQETLAATEHVIRKTFEVIPDLADFEGSHYCSVSDLRDQGYTSSMLSDIRALKTINTASAYIDRVTGRQFDAKYKTLLLNGSLAPDLLLEEPIVGIDNVRIHISPYEPNGFLMPNDIYVVYNRHLSQNLKSPDDRDNPKLALLSDRSGVFGYYGRSEVYSAPYHVGQIWNAGVQNVKLTGIFGYTEYDGSPWGRTPLQLVHCCKLLCVREMPQLADFDEREARKERWRLRSERSEDQSYQLETLKHQGTFTGDAEIDYLLAQYTRPMQIAAV
jgi:hypothetical protein